MSNSENTTSQNAYKAARLAAAKKDDELDTLESASGKVNIGREKLGQIEQEDPKKKQALPDSDDVARMIQIYGAPELRNHFCANVCPLGKEYVPNLEYKNLDRVSLQLLVALQRIEQVRDDLGNILVDGNVGASEKEKFQEIVATLKHIANQANALELWAQKNNLI